DRRAALWQVLGQGHKPQDLPLFRDSADEEAQVSLPPLSEWQQVVADYLRTGLTLRSHPLAFCREHLTRMRVVTAKALHELPSDYRVRVAGLVLVRQRPATANGVTFVTLEDETGAANLIVHQRTWERFYPLSHRSNAWLVTGRLQREAEVAHVIVARLEDLYSRLGWLSNKSRDFH